MNSTLDSTTGATIANEQQLANSSNISTEMSTRTLRSKQKLRQARCQVNNRKFNLQNRKLIEALLPTDNLCNIPAVDYIKLGENQIYNRKRGAEEKCDSAENSSDHASDILADLQLDIPSDNECPQYSQNNKSNIANTDKSTDKSDHESDNEMEFFGFNEQQIPVKPSLERSILAEGSALGSASDGLYFLRKRKTLTPVVTVSETSHDGNENIPASVGKKKVLRNVPSQVSSSKKRKQPSKEPIEKLSKQKWKEISSIMIKSNMYTREISNRHQILDELKVKRRNRIQWTKALESLKLIMYKIFLQWDERGLFCTNLLHPDENLLKLVRKHNHLSLGLMRN